MERLIHNRPFSLQKVVLTDRPALPYLSALVLELYRWAPIAPLGASSAVYSRLVALREGALTQCGCSCAEDEA